MKRSEYLLRYGLAENPREIHREYYAQFVTPEVLKLVRGVFSIATLKLSRDERFTDIATMEVWEYLARRLPSSLAKKMVECEDTLCDTAKICILKEAAQQLREGFPSNNGEV